ncbi:MAG: SBBP repeat-containing protein, partial [Bacteroidota bacterium]
YIDGDDVSFIMPGSYDHDKPLVIECAREEDQPMGIGYQPQWCSYFGGNSFDEGKAVGTDSDGNVYFTGFTQSSNFPTLTGFQILNPGNGTDAFISKFGKTGDPSSYPDATIDELLWSTYYGGSAHTVKGLSIAVSGDGSTGKVFVAGSANGEASFPVFAANSEYNQTFFPSNHTTGVIIGLDNASGGGGATPYRYASYFGGSGSSGVGAEQINAIKIDGSGNIYIAGTTNSAACSSAYYCSVPGDFGFPICNASGAGLVNQGNGDAFIAMFDNTVQLQWSTFYGGSETDVINAIAIDSDNNLYVAGETNSGSSAATPFPVTTSGNYDQSFGGGTSDAFVAKYSGTSRQWSTFFGGSGSDAALAITIDQENKVYFGGITSSFTPAPIYDNLCVVTSNDCNEPPAGNFPIADGNFTGSVGTPFYIQNVPFGGGPDPNCGYSCINALYGGGGTDGFIARFDKNANFDWSTYVGGSDNDKITSLTVANYEDYGHIPKHRICFSGQTFSTDFREYSQSNGLLTYLRSYDWPANHPTAFDHSGFLGLGEIPDRLCVPWTTYFIQQGANNPSSNPLQDDINAICAYDQHLYYTGSVIKDFVGNSPVPLQKMLNIPTAYGVFVHNGGGTDVLIGRHSFDRPIWDQIPENKKQESFSVYPNPSTGSYTLILENTQYKKINLQVFNMMGQILLSKDKEAGHNSDEIIIDLSGNPVGIYFLQLTLDDIKISKKIILQE